MSYHQVAELRNLFCRILNPSDPAMDGTITDAKIATCFGMLEEDSFKFLKLERSYHQQVSKQERRRGPVES